MRTATGPATSWWRSRQKLDQALKGRANSFGLLRLLLALSVVASHAFPLGWGKVDPLLTFSGQQTDLGSIAVIGFFVLSGFMITSSGRRLGIFRYAWHRALRIFPGLWVCVLLTALVVAPLLFLHQHGSTAGFWGQSHGPVRYIRHAATTNVSLQWDVSGVIAQARHAGTNFNGAFDGALWSLKYELCCYIMVGLLAVVGVLRKLPVTVLLITAALWVDILVNQLNAPGWRGTSGEAFIGVQVPLLGAMNSHFAVYLGFAFLLGGSFQLYRHRLPVNDALGVLCLLLLPATLHWGAFTVLGYPALGYALIWLGVRLPAQLQWIGQKSDFSYGIYIYGFVVEQTLSMFGVNDWGYLGYTAISMAITTGVAWLSWHLVESRAMRLKDWTPPRPGRRQRAAAEPSAELQPA
jgi:peptidoglycan/LPS O-acetylase OafA/YrhL